MPHAHDSSLIANAKTVSYRTAHFYVQPVISVGSENDTPMPGFPHRLGDYEVRRELGRGGMGIVYEGYDAKLRRTVALKILKGGSLSNEDLLQRFRTEAEAVAQLQHPHIVQIYEVSSHDGNPFVALEYLPGGSLFQRIGGKPLPPQQAAEYCLALANAASHAHNQGILHRDLKPANVLFTADGTPKITDFGTARRIDDGIFGSDPGLTRAGEVIGTPQYMSPEQASGFSAAVGPTADIYSLGAILYELLTGRPPFTGIDPVDVIYAVRTQEPISPRKLQPKIPRDLETICLKCLEKKPKHRYDSARELEHDLRQFLIGDTITARPTGLFRRTCMRAKRYPAISGLIVGALFACIFGVTAFWLQFQETTRARDEAIENAKTAETNAREAERARLGTEIKNIEAMAHLADANWNFYRGKISQSQLHLELSNAVEAGNRLDEAPVTLRGWEWDVLRSQTGDSLWSTNLPDVVPNADICWMHSQSLSPNGSLLAVLTGSPYEQNNVKENENPCSLLIVRVADGTLVRSWVRQIPVYCNTMRWISDRIIITFDLFGHARAWDIETNQLLFERKNTGMEDGLRDYKLSNEGILICREDIYTLNLFNCFTGELLNKVTLETPNERFISVSPDGSRLVLESAMDEHSEWYTRIVDVASNQTLHRYPIRGWNNSQFSPDGKWLIRFYHADESGHLVVHDAQSMKVIWSRTAPLQTFAGFRFSPEGKRILLMMYGFLEMYGYDLATGEHPTIFRGFEGIQRDVIFSPDGSWIVTVGDDQIVRLFNATTGAMQSRHRGHNRSVRTCTFTADGRNVISGGADERLISWDLTRTRAAGGLMPPLQTGGPGTTMAAIGFNEKGDLSILNTYRGIIEFDPATANPTKTKKMDFLPVRDAKELRDFAFSDHCERFVGRQTIYEKDGAKKDIIHVWDRKSGAILKSFHSQFHRLFTLAISPDGKRIAAGGYRKTKEVPIDPRLLIWDVETGYLISDHHTDVPLISLAFDPKGDGLAGGYLRMKDKPGPLVSFFNSKGQIAKSVDTYSKDPESRHAAYVNFLTYSPDGKSLVGSCWGVSVIFVVDALKGELLKTIKSSDPITNIAFTPDGSRIATTGYIDLVTIRDTKTWDETVRFVCAPGRVDDWAFPALIAFSPDGRSLAATHWNGDFTLWHVEELGNPNGPTYAQLRAKSEASAFRYHLFTAGEAIRRNDPYAYQFHEKYLHSLTPPTEALKQEWNAVKLKLQPQLILQAVGGGLITNTDDKNYPIAFRNSSNR